MDHAWFDDIITCRRPGIMTRQRHSMSLAGPIPSLAAEDDEIEIRLDIDGLSWYYSGSLYFKTFKWNSKLYIKYSLITNKHKNYLSSYIVHVTLLSYISQYS